MKRAMRYAVLSVAAVTSVAAGQQQQQQTPDPAQVQMAEQFATLAMQSLAQKQIGPAEWSQGESLAMAAEKLDPTNRRWPELVARLADSAGDTNQIILADKALLKLEPGHRGAQTQLIDIYLSRMQTSDAKSKYLQAVVDNQGLARDVRSYAAVRLARVLGERSEKKQAIAMLAKAVELNPWNAPAWEMHYQLIEPEATVLEKVKDLLGMLRANPAQPNTIWNLARQMNQVGLEKQSLNWYAMAIAGLPRSGEPLPEDILVDFGSAMYLGGDAKAANALIERSLSANASAPQIWLLKAAIEKQQNDPELRQTIAQANVACFNAIQMLRQHTGDKQATTRPVDLGEPVTLPNMSDDLARIAADKTGRMRAVYISNVSNWAWLEIYFARRPQDARHMMEFLGQLLPANDPTLNRLQGWSDFVQGDDSAAHAKFVASAKVDPLSAMGLLLLEAKTDHDKVLPEARRLLSENSVGIVGAMLYSGLKPIGIDLIPDSKSAAVDAEIQKFPSDWMHVLDQPQSFYSVHIQPLDVGYAYDQPVLVRVAIQNLAGAPLSIGSAGIIKPGILIDAQQRGAGDTNFAGTAFVRMDQAMILGPGDEISQIVRVDRGQFGQMLQKNPGLTYQFTLFATTNPIMSGEHLYVGLAGYHVRMPGVIQRDGVSLNTQNWQQQINQMMSSDNGGDRIRGIHLLAEYANLMRNSSNATDDTKKQADAFMGIVSSAMSDPSSAVQATAVYAVAMAAPEKQRWTKLQAMTEQSDWQQQLLGAYGLKEAPVAMQKTVDQKLASSGAEPCVKKFAAARLTALEHPAKQP